MTTGWIIFCLIYGAGAFFFAGAYVGCMGCIIEDQQRGVVYPKPIRWDADHICPVILVFLLWPICIPVIATHGWKGKP